MDYDSYVKLVLLIIKGSICVNKEDDLDGWEILFYFLSVGDICFMFFSCCMMNKCSVICIEVVEDILLIGIFIKYVDQWMLKY